MATLLMPAEWLIVKLAAIAMFTAITLPVFFVLAHKSVLGTLTWLSGLIAVMGACKMANTAALYMFKRARG
jgi:hypothetical protein